MTVALSRVDPRPFFAGLPLIVRLVLREQRFCVGHRCR